jgi:hypothetical protein
MDSGDYVLDNLHIVSETNQRLTRKHQSDQIAMVLFARCNNLKASLAVRIEGLRPERSHMRALT